MYVGIANADGVVYCNIKGNNVTNALISLGAKFGGEILIGLYSYLTI